MAKSKNNSFMCPVCRKIYFKHPEPMCECEKKAKPEPRPNRTVQKTGRKQKHKILTETKLKKWRGAVMSRDNYTCRHCGAQGKVAHHIKKKSKFPELALDIENGLTLCHTCHGNEHKMAIDEESGLFMSRKISRGGSPGGDSKSRNTSSK